jgi:hypothetical protein
MTRWLPACLALVLLATPGCEDETPATLDMYIAPDSAPEEAGKIPDAGTAETGSDLATTDTQASDAKPQDQAADKATPDTTAPDTTAPDTAAPDTAATDTIVTIDGQACTPMTTTPVTHTAFTSWENCAGVKTNSVIKSTAEETKHVTDYCTTVSGCVFPAPTCPAPPGLGYGSSMVLYVFGTSSGCSGQATITKVLDCKTQILVQYTVQGNGGCATMVNAWASVQVAASSLPVKFSK